MPFPPNKDFWKVYETLPQELKDAVFAEETGDAIYKTCERNGALDMVGEITDLVGQVLTGILPQEDFESRLATIGAVKGKAKQIALELHRLVFFPRKTVIEQLHASSDKTSAKFGKKTSKQVAGTVKEMGTPASLPEPTKKRSSKTGKDKYLEPIE